MAKLIAAVSVIALFGGFLLASMGTSPDAERPVPAAVNSSPSPEPSSLAPTTNGLLPSGAATDQIQPGILRILEDGAGHSHRGWEGDQLRNLVGIHAAPDGSVWILTDTSQAWRVGMPGLYDQTVDGFPGESWWGTPVVTSTPDGRLWIAGAHLASFDGESWTRHDPRGPSGHIDYDYKFPRTISELPDGSLWAAWWFDIGRLDRDGWTIFGSYEPPGDDRPMGTSCRYPFTDFTRRVVALADGSPVAGGPGCLARFDGSTWQELESPDIAANPMGDEIRVGGDGVLWAHINTADYMEPSDDHLARYEGGGWSVFPIADGIARMRTVGASNGEAQWDVDADGAVWVLTDRVAPDADEDERRLWSFDGTDWTLRAKDIEWFTIDRRGTVWTSDGSGTSYLDGGTWHRYPRVQGVHALDIAEDGTVWALGDEHSIFVIDADAPTVAGGTSKLPVASDRP